MEGANGLPIYEISITNKLQQVLHGEGKLRYFNAIKPNPAYKYASRVIVWVNEEESKLKEKKTYKNVMIKVSGFR